MTVRAATLAFLPLLQAAPDWTASGDADFGRSLAVLDADGDGIGELLVGAPGQGAVFLFKPPSDVPAWTVQGPFRIARAGDVNGDGFEDAAVADAERSSVHLGSPAGLSTSAAWSAPGSVPAGIGDVNGDGFDDLAVGDPSGALGRVDVYLGSADGLAATPVWSSVGQAQAFSGFGTAIAAAGDVDGDGFDDFLLGAPFHDHVVGTVDLDLFYYDDVVDPVDLPVGVGIVPDTGKAWLIAGSAAGPERTPRWSSIGTPLARDRFGLALAGGTDVSGDGRPDAMAASARPEAIAYFAYGSGLSLSPNWIHVGRTIDADDPVALGMGDVNGDGEGDLVVVDRVSLRVFEGPHLTHGLVWTSDTLTLQFGPGLAVGDLSGDGIDDLATAGQGTVRVIYGRPAAAPADPGAPTAVAAGAGSDDRSSGGCGLLGAEALLALVYLSSRMRRARNQTSSP